MGACHSAQGGQEEAGPRSAPGGESAAKVRPSLQRPGCWAGDPSCPTSSVQKLSLSSCKQTLRNRCLQLQAAHPQQVTPLPADAPASASKGDSAATAALAPVSTRAPDAAPPAGGKSSSGDALGRQHAGAGEPSGRTVCYDSASSYPDHLTASDAGSQRSSIDVHSSAHAQRAAGGPARPPPQPSLPWRRRGEGEDDAEANRRVSIDSIAPVLIDDQPATPVERAPPSPDLCPAPVFARVLPFPWSLQESMHMQDSEARHTSAGALHGA